MILDRIEASPFQALLNHQLLTARWHADQAVLQSPGGADLWDVVESLELTQGWGSGVRSEDPISLPTFVWEGAGNLKMRGHDLPLNGTYLNDRFLDAGVRPAPGQVFLLPPRLVIDAIEEALDRLDRVRTSVEQALKTLGIWSKRGGSDDPKKLREAIQLDEAQLAELRGQTLRLTEARATAQGLLRPPPRHVVRMVA